MRLAFFTDRAEHAKLRALIVQRLEEIPEHNEEHCKKKACADCAMRRALAPPKEDNNE